MAASTVIQKALEGRDIRPTAAMSQEEFLEFWSANRIKKPRDANSASAISELLGDLMEGESSMLPIPEGLTLPQFSKRTWVRIGRDKYLRRYSWSTVMCVVTYAQPFRTEECLMITKGREKVENNPLPTREES